jgi:D-tyrosyl-tRNA(Tyr) deacylase
MLVLGGFGRDDGPAEATWMARKIAGLRVFGDDTPEPRHSVNDIAGEVLVVSQFTLLADCRKGRRPSYDRAMPAEVALPLFERFVDELRPLVRRVATGIFGAEMRVQLVNDGPFTLVIDAGGSGASNPSDS